MPELGLAFLPAARSAACRDAAERGDQWRGVRTVAEKHGVSPQQVCLAWELSPSPSGRTDPGASRPESVTDSAQAADLVLDAEDLAALNP